MHRQLTEGLCLGVRPKVQFLFRNYVEEPLCDHGFLVYFRQERICYPRSFCFCLHYFFTPLIFSSTSSFIRSRVLDQSSANGPTQRSYICRIGTTLSELIRRLPSSRVFMSPTSRSTSMCFITACRVISGKASTISVVVLASPRNRSSIVRRVGSDRAFHTGSSSSAINYADEPDA